MRKSRKKKKSGKQSTNIHIIPRTQHHISKTDISINALKVLNRLNSAGFEAYLVGGSVRDLLLRKAPKDFDVATNATPTQIKNLFRNARIIGRRFKLVHMLFHREIIEVATFRGHEPQDTLQLTNDKGMLIRDNVYGTLEEDAFRRDFTVNSLYYNIDDSSIVDYTGGVQDIHDKIIRIIGDPNKRYQEDPVRMLRAIRFSAKLHFEIAEDTAAPLYTLSHLITHVSGSRLFDEMTKLFQCGEAESVHRMMVDFGLFQYLFPLTAALLDDDYPVKALLGIALENTDTRIKEGKPITPAFLFAVLLWFPLINKAEKLREEGLSPLPALEKAMSFVISEQNKSITIPKRYTQVMREIWIMQFRFSKRTGNRPFNLLQHPRFRAAFDFLALRALAGNESLELAQWWTTFQEMDEEIQHKMIAELPETPMRKPRKRKPKPKPKPSE
ncbi:poly(A) polymerase (plasmid) [Legionella adelaidensis]|uniref:Poly(A) polymerase I n=1 Tax=Legionella adelaidensis TaxID=45056 RepID=A0A0W0R224_9GAMM|nr:polynucleotide adenylyltransferase PcnB [Legionella adelaidensis]KTC65151.1 poly(A) polymerase [Legionella adelaidensis]VEH85043.1 poly(A) polymerase [Legionella adelaidensis]